MKIALLGYGKMGMAIEAIAIERGHDIVLKVDKHNADTCTVAELQMAEVAIEFSTPHTVLNNVNKCIEAKIPVVIGATGWYEKIEEIKEKTLTQNAAALWASNFSVGVNLFFALNKKFAQLMQTHKDYAPVMHEIHHVHKLDAPSGTAISLAKDLMQVNGIKNWSCETIKHGESVPKVKTSELKIFAERTDEVPGTHEVTYFSEVDEISIKHTAHSRKGFALGAVLGAEWIKGRKGFYNFAETL